MNLEAGYQVISIISMAVLAVLAALCLIRCILGPRISDRIMAVNMISTLSIIMIAVMTVYLNEGYLADIAIIYALLSFLAVVVLCKVYTGIYRERKAGVESLLRVVDDRDEMEEAAALEKEAMRSDDVQKVMEAAEVLEDSNPVECAAEVMEDTVAKDAESEEEMIEDAKAAFDPQTGEEPPEGGNA